MAKRVKTARRGPANSSFRCRKKGSSCSGGKKKEKGKGTKKKEGAEFCGERTSRMGLARRKNRRNRIQDFLACHYVVTIKNE